MFLAPREPSRSPAGHSNTQEVPTASVPEAVGEVRAVLPNGARDRPKDGNPVASSPRVSYNIVPQKTWLTESRVLRISAKTEAIQSRTASVLGFRVGATWRSGRVFVPAFRGTPFSLPSVISEGALARSRGSPHEQVPGQRSVGQQCRGCAMGVKIRQRADSCSPQRGRRNHCQVFPAYGK